MAKEELIELEGLVTDKGRVIFRHKGERAAPTPSGPVRNAPWRR